MFRTEAKPRTLFDKIWDSHVVERFGDGTCVLYVDRHLLDEHGSPRAFDGLRAAGLRVRRPEATIAVADHNIPTEDRRGGITDEKSRLQVETLEANVEAFGVPYMAGQVDDNVDIELLDKDQRARIRRATGWRMKS